MIPSSLLMLSWMNPSRASPTDWSLSPGISPGHELLPSSFIHQSLREKDRSCQYRVGKQTNRKRGRYSLWILVPKNGGQSENILGTVDRWKKNGAVWEGWEPKDGRTIFLHFYTHIPRTRLSTSPWGGLLKREKSEDGEKVRKRASLSQTLAGFTSFCSSIF